MNSGLHNFWQLIKTSFKILAGILLILVGFVLLFLPGPGWLLIFAGIFLLGPESRPARFLRRQFKRVQAWVRARRIRRARRRTQVRAATQSPPPADSEQ